MTLNGIAWESLGVYHVQSSTIQVMLSDQAEAGSVVVADAVRLIEVSERVDRRATTDGGGHFTHLPTGLTLGDVSIRVRTRELDSLLVEFDIAVDPDPNAPFEGTFDNVIDGSVLTDADGRFTFSPQGLPPGEVGVRARVKEYADDSTVLYSNVNWADCFCFVFVLNSATYEIDSLELTADGGNDATDGATDDRRVSVHIACPDYNYDLSQVKVEFDYNRDGVADEELASLWNTSFDHQPSHDVEDLNTVQEGYVTVSACTAVGEDEALYYGDWTSVAFIWYDDVELDQATATTARNGEVDSANAAYNEAVAEADAAVDLAVQAFNTDAELARKRSDARDVYEDAVEDIKDVYTDALKDAAEAVRRESADNALRERAAAVRGDYEWMMFDNHATALTGGSGIPLQDYQDAVADADVSWADTVRTAHNAYYGAEGLPAAEAAAETSCWSQETTAYTALLADVASAEADFTSAKYVETAARWNTLGSGEDLWCSLPWTQYQVDLAGAMCDWWDPVSEDGAKLDYVNWIDVYNRPRGSGGSLRDSHGRLH